MSTQWCWLPHRNTHHSSTRHKKCLRRQALSQETKKDSYTGPESQWCTLNLSVMVFFIWFVTATCSLQNSFFFKPFLYYSLGAQVALVKLYFFVCLKGSWKTRFLTERWKTAGLELAQESKISLSTPLISSPHPSGWSERDLHPTPHSRLFF